MSVVMTGEKAVIFRLTLAHQIKHHAQPRSGPGRRRAALMRGLITVERSVSVIHKSSMLNATAHRSFNTADTGTQSRGENNRTNISYVSKISLQRSNLYFETPLQGHP